MSACGAPPPPSGFSGRAEDDLSFGEKPQSTPEGEGLESVCGSLQAQNCLTKLYKLDKMQFRQTMRDYVNKDSLNNVVDFLHALLGFCMEPVTDSK